jgi:hypothetical protein
VDHPLFEYNMVLARLLNRISTLEGIGVFQIEHNTERLQNQLEVLNGEGPIWGNAYVITTHGQKMDKLAYLAQVMDAVHANLELIRAASRGWPAIGQPVRAHCQLTSEALQTIPGIGSFLSAQVVADLKNTPNHPLHSASDKATFVQPGPGSIRGASWFHIGSATCAVGGGGSGGVTTTTFPRYFQQIREYVDANWPEDVPSVDNQDLQNCLCEYDKYCRVKNGTGRSKRNYDGR